MKHKMKWWTKTHKFRSQSSNNGRNTKNPMVQNLPPNNWRTVKAISVGHMGSEKRQSRKIQWCIIHHFLNAMLRSPFSDKAISIAPFFAPLSWCGKLCAQVWQPLSEAAQTRARASKNHRNMGSIWGWVKTYCSHISGNKHPWTSTSGVPRYQGFDP